MVKLVISDMDGTLIDRDEVLPEKAVNIVHALKEKRNYVYYCDWQSGMYG